MPARDSDSSREGANRAGASSALAIVVQVAVVIGSIVALPRAGFAQKMVIVKEDDTAVRLKERFRAITEQWAKEAVLKKSEREAIQNGRQWEDLMTVGSDDPLGRRILRAGEPSYDSVAAYYPGKVLDRTVLGTYSDPRSEGNGSGEEFILWWNGALSANLLERRLSGTIQPVAENTNVVFRVGPDAEMFGKVGARYSRIGYEQGYLPIVVARYESGGLLYEETALADRPPGETTDEDVAFVRFQITNNSPAPRTAELHEDVIVIDETKAHAEGQRVLVAPHDLILAHSDPRASFDQDKQRLSHRFDLRPGEQAAVYFKLPYRPDATGRLKPPDQESFDASHAQIRRFWSEHLSRGVEIDVPEPRVNTVWRALLLQNFVLADGPRMTYGSGTRYNRSYYPVESGLTGNDLAFYGYADQSHALLEFCMKESLDPRRAGRKYQNRRGVALRQLYENYRLTRRLDVFDRFRNDIIRVAEEIISDRRSTMVELDGKRPLHWGLLPPSRPGVDVRASTQTVYVPAHNITNCQGLQDLGSLLVESERDKERGERYLRAAREYRKTLLDAMERSVIRSEERPPFVPLETLYFTETPDYGPQPYDHLALGRLQGVYYHDWADIILNYNFFNPDDRLTRWITDYLEQKGGFVLGCTQARRRPGQNYGWIANVYNGGYYNVVLRRGDVEKFLLGFYARLAYAMSRHAYIAAESAPFIGYNTENGGYVAADQPFPCSAANSETLRMLRQMLILEELKDNIATGTIFLASGAPRAWYRQGAAIVVKKAPTFLGEMSFAIESAVDQRRISARIEPPKRDRYASIVVSVRHPARAPIRRVEVNGREHRDFDSKREQVRLPAGPDRFAVEVFY